MTKKIAVSLPDEQVDSIRRAVEHGRDASALQAGDQEQTVVTSDPDDLHAIDAGLRLILV